jgi:hypothetical protein
MSNKILYGFLFLAALFLRVETASAAWTAFASFSTTQNIVSDPSCAPWGSGQAICVGRNTSNQLIANRWTGTAWSAAQIVGSGMTTDPSCAFDGVSKVYCVTTASNNVPQVTIYNGVSFSVPAGMGIAPLTTSKPSCVSHTAGKFVCLARSTTAGLVSMVFNGATWSTSALAGTTTSAPNCSEDGIGGAICAVITTANHAVLAYRFNGATWSLALNLGGEASSETTCNRVGPPGQVMCVASGRNSDVFVRRFNGGTFSLANWSPWGSIGGVTPSNTRCAPVGAIEAVCATIATLDSVLYINRFNGTTWLGWAKIGTSTAFRSPTCTPLSATKAMCAMIRTDNKLVTTVGP